MKELIKEWKIFSRKREIEYQIDLIESISYKFEKNYFDNLTISYLNESAEEDEIIKANGLLSKVAGNKKLKGILGIGMILVITTLGCDNIMNMIKNNPGNLKPAIESTVDNLENELPEEYRGSLSEATPFVYDAIEQNAQEILERKAEIESIDLNVLKGIFAKKVIKRKKSKTNLNKKVSKVSSLGARVTGRGGPSSKIKSGTVKGTVVLPDPSEDQLIEMSKSLSKDITADISLNNQDTGKHVIESISVQTQISIQTHTTKAYKKIKESAKHFHDISKRYSTSSITDGELDERLDKFIDKYGLDSGELRQVSQLTGLLITCKAHTDMCVQTINALNQGGEFQSTIKMGAGRHTKSVDGKYQQKTTSAMENVFKATSLSIKRYNILVEIVTANYLTLKSKDIKEKRDKLPASVKSSIIGILSSLINEDGSVDSESIEAVSKSVTEIGIVSDASDSVKISGITNSDAKGRNIQSP